MRKKLIGLTLLTAIALTGCTNGVSSDKLETLIAKLQSGYTVSGTVKNVIKHYTNDNFNVLNTNLEDKIETYDFEFTYQDSSEYIGVDRNIYKLDGKEKRLVIDDNCFSDNGAVKLNVLDVDNTVNVYDAMSSQDDTGLNAQSYGSSYLSNPFLNMDTSDITYRQNDTYSFNPTKISKMVLNMFASIDPGAFGMAVTRNVFTLDENGGIDKLFVYLDEYTNTITNADYTYDYVGNNYSIIFSFSDEGTANAKNKLSPYENKPQNDRLGAILKKMEGQKLIVNRRDVTIFNGIEYEDSYETIVNYFDGEKIFYQIYDAAREEVPTEVRGSDFLLMPMEGKEGLYPYTRSADGKWAYNGGFSKVEGWNYDEYLPLLGEISEDIFTYDEATDTYHVPEYLAIYWTADKCLLPGIMISSAVFGNFTNDVEIKLKANGDIDYARIKVYFDSGIYIQTGYYELTYEYGDSIKMPFKIDEEVSK